MLGLKSLRTATKMIAGIEAMHMVKKTTQIKGAVYQKSEYIYPALVWIERIRADSVRNPCLM